MNKENILKNANIMDTVLQMPQVFIEQFIKISAYYLAYVNMDEPSNKDRTDYINESYNAMTLLNKLIATASYGGKIEYQVKVPEEERLNNDTINEEEIIEEKDAIKEELESMYVDELFDNAVQSNNSSEKYEFEEKYNSEYDDEEYNTSTNYEKRSFYMLMEEMNNWGIKETSFAHKCVVAMYHCCTYLDSPESVINKVADYLDRPTGTISNAFNYILKNANFENSQYCDTFKNKNRMLISRSELISELEYFVR